MTDERSRAELLLLANLEIGMHEQTRLQPEIRESLDAPYTVKQDLDRRLSLALMPWWRRRVPRVVAAPVGAAGARAQRALADMLREIVTRALMVMSLPGRVLALGANMDEPFPEALRELRDADLLALFARFDVPLAVAPATRTAARDWSDFDQRMRYIAHLFRAFHLHEELLGPPFTPSRCGCSRPGRCPTAICEHRPAASLCCDGQPSRLHHTVDQLTTIRRGITVKTIGIYICRA